MSQRLTSIRKNTTEKPLWRSPEGVPFYLPFGAAPDDDDDAGNDGADADDDADDDDEDDSGSEDQGEKGKKKDSEDGDLAERLRRTEERMKAADKRAAAAEKRARQYEDKDKSELELAQREANEAREKAAKAEADLQSSRIRIAFLASNDITWHNPDRALSLADLSEVSVDEDGNVDRKALKAALQALAKSDSYLVKNSASGGDGEDDGDGGESGAGVGSGRKGKRGKYDREALEKSFPALMGR